MTPIEVAISYYSTIVYKLHKLVREQILLLCKPSNDGLCEFCVIVHSSWCEDMTFGLGPHATTIKLTTEKFFDSFQEKGMKCEKEILNEYGKANVKDIGNICIRKLEFMRHFISIFKK